MIVESQQILACCEKHLFGEVSILKSTNELFKTPKSRMNHPVVLWARLSKSHMRWLLLHLTALYREYNGIEHINVKRNCDKLLAKLGLANTGPSYFLNFAKNTEQGLDFTHIKDVFTAYKKLIYSKELQK